jgi:ketosteroid isomerase-like protein
MDRRDFSGALLLGLGFAYQAAAEEGNVVAEVTRLKKALVEAYVRRDATALQSIYADDFVSTDAQGRTRTKGDELADLAKGESALESGSYDVVAVRVFGDVAVMSGHGNLVWRSSEGPRVSRYYSFNVFVKRDGRWRYAAAFLP